MILDLDDSHCFADISLRAPDRPVPVQKRPQNQQAEQKCQREDKPPARDVLARRNRWVGWGRFDWRWSGCRFQLAYKAIAPPGKGLHVPGFSSTVAQGSANL